MPSCQHRGVTIVELLVVIGVSALLAAILMPAVQAARESSRRATCENHLRQIGGAVAEHESAYRRFPSGGWGFGWVGDPDRGTARSQPGGWVFNVLKFVEQANLASLGSGEATDEKRATATVVVQTPLALFNCPSRRPVELAPFDPWPAPVNFNVVADVAKSDYAINAGDNNCPGGTGPRSLTEGDSPGYLWQDASQCDGVCFLRSEVKLAEVRDGTAFTYLAGEKWTNGTEHDMGDDQTLYTGYDYDTYRWGKPNKPPIGDGGSFEPDRFGSAHAAVCNMLFCDGSVRPISYTINAEVHRRLANRADHLPVLGSEF